MADQTVTLRITTNADGVVAGVAQIRDQLGTIGASAERAGTQSAAGFAKTRGGLTSISTQLAAVRQQVLGFGAAFVSIQGARQLAAIADSYANMTARIKLAVGETQSLSAAQDSVFAIAQRTSSGLEATTTLYARMSAALKDANVAQRDVLALTETISQSFAVSGASATEAGGAITQLSQAMAAGALRGDEFNSVNEAAPRLMQALASSLGVTRGELRKMAEQGEITSDVLRRALSGDEAQKIAAEYSQLPLTIGRAFTQLENGWIRFIGQSDQASGASRKVADAIRFVAVNMDALMGAAITLGGVLLTLYTTKMLMSAAAFTAGLIAQGVQLARNTVLAIQMGTAMQGSMLASLRSIGLVNVALGGIGALIAGWQIGTYLRNEFQIVADAGAYLAYGFIQALTSIENVAKVAFAGLKFAAVAAIDAARNSLADLVQGFVEISQIELPAGLRADFTFGAGDKLTALAAALRTTSGATDEAGKEVDRLREAWRNANVENDAMLEDMLLANAYSADAKDALGEQAQATNELAGETANFSEALKTSTDASKQSIDAVLEWEDALRDAQEAMAELAAGNLDLDADLRDMREELAGVTPAQRQFNRELEKANLLYAQSQALGFPNAAAATQAAAEYEARVARLREFYSLSLELDASQELADNNRRAAEDSARSWEDFAGQLVDAFSKGTRGIKDLFKRMLADLARQLATSAVLRGLASLFGGSFSGLAMASGNGGGGSLLGSMFSSYLGSSSGGTAGAGLAQFAPVGGALAGAYYGAQNRPNMGSRVAAGAAYGVGGYAVGTVAYGAALGYGAAGAAGAVSGGIGAAAAIPVVGWIIAALALIDAFSGGKLFGTKYQTRGSTMSLGVGQAGGTAGLTLQQERQAALFGGIRRRNQTQDAGDDAREAADALYASQRATLEQVNRQLLGDFDELLEGGIRVVTRYSKKGKVESTKYFVDVLGRSFEEASFELAQTRLGAEQIIAAIDGIFGNTVEQIANTVNSNLGGALAGALTGVRGTGLAELAEDAGSGGGIGGGTGISTLLGEASAIAERWRGNAEELMAGAQALLAIATDIRNGFDLLGTGTLTPIVDLVDELAYGGETLIQTYQRLAQSTLLLEQALEMSGVSLDKTRDEFVRFANDFVEAAGGLERASALWSGYYDTFYTGLERLDFAISQAQKGLTKEFSDIGLNASDFAGEGGAAAFRELFESKLPTLSAAAIVEWLEAGNALGIVIDLEAQRTDALREQTDAQIAALQAQAEALAEYDALTQSLRDELDAAGMSEFALAMRDINRWTADSIDALNAAARAAGAQGAAETDLALVHDVAAQRAAAAIARLRDAAADLVADIFGTPLDQINAQISAIESAQASSTAGQLAGIDAIGAAAADVYGAQLSALQNIREYLDSQLLGNLSTLTPEQRLAEAQRQFDAAAAAAAGGDVEALARLTQLADTLLREGRDFNSSGQNFTDLEAAVRARLAGILAGGPTVAPGGGVSPGAIGGVGGQPISPELQALYDQRDAMLDAQIAEQRADMLRELGLMVRELIQATGDPLAEVAASIGLNLTALAQQLGINLDELSGDTALSLTNLARQLGVDVAELATNVGVDLGKLGDRQSLLNQALDATLADVPQELRDQLRDPLAAIRNATTEADANAAIQAAEAAILDMPAGIRDLLAPFFEGIGPDPIVTELTTLRGINAIGQQQLDTLVQMRDLLEQIAGLAPDATQPLPEFAVGTGFVARTGAAVIHSGEAILPAAVNAFAQRSGLQIGPVSQPDHSAVVAELRLTRAANDAQARRMEEALKRIEDAEKNGAERMATAMREARLSNAAR